MNESEALSRMVAPGTRRPNKPFFGGVIQVWLTRACDKACFGCTQGSNLGGSPGVMTPAQAEAAIRSLDGYFGVVGIFGGNPALSPYFEEICAVLRRHVPFERRGLWCNHPKGHGRVMRETFNPAVSNLNVHLDADAHAEFKRDWPESRPFGLHEDSRHSPVHLAMRDVVPDEGERWGLIADCDVNKFWSAMVGVFRGGVRAWFCEVAGAQAMLHQHEPDYPDTGLPIGGDGLFRGRYDTYRWWELGMPWFAGQVRKHCHECSVPLRGYGELACSADGVEQTSAAHAGVFRPKRPGRRVEIVTTVDELRRGRVTRTTDYLGNAKR